MATRNSTYDLKTREQALAYGLSFPDTYQDAPFHDANWQLVRMKGSKKAFLWTYERDGFINLNVKAEAEARDFWRSVYEAVVPGWHQNKEHWNTIILDGSIPDDDIRRMISESYDLVADSPSKRIYEAVKRIPSGHVATYSQVAETAAAAVVVFTIGILLDMLRSLCFGLLHRLLSLSGTYRRLLAWLETLRISFKKEQVNG